MHNFHFLKKLQSKVRKHAVWWEILNISWSQDYQDIACQKLWIPVQASSSYRKLNSGHFYCVTVYRAVTVKKLYLKCTVDELDDQIKLLMIQHGSVALDVKAQLLHKANSSCLVLQCSQHCGKYLQASTDRQQPAWHAAVCFQSQESSLHTIFWLL